jgi:hypothetical protein
VNKLLIRTNGEKTLDFSMQLCYNLASKGVVNIRAECGQVNILGAIRGLTDEAFAL